MKRWCLIIAALCVAIPVQAQTVWIISTTSDSNLTIVSPDEYLRRVGTCTRFDSAQAIFNDLVRTLPRADARDDFERLSSYGTWQIILDVEGFLPPDDGLFTNVEFGIPECPRTFISVDLLLDRRRSDCQKRALLLFEWRHVRDFINGRSSAFMSVQTEPKTLAEALELLEFEYRGFREQLYWEHVGGCPDNDGWFQAYRTGGLPRLRWVIAVTYGLLDKFPNKRELIWNACRWIPWDP